MIEPKLQGILIELGEFFGPYKQGSGEKHPIEVLEQKNYQLMAFAAGLMIGAQIDREQVMKVLEKK